MLSCSEPVEELNKFDMVFEDKKQTNKQTNKRTNENLQKYCKQTNKRKSPKILLLRRRLRVKRGLHGMQQVQEKKTKKKRTPHMYEQ